MVRHRIPLWTLLVAVVVIGTACSPQPGTIESAGDEPGTSTAASAAASQGLAADGALTVLIGSSGDAETNAVNAAVADWSAATGIEAEVVVASDLSQQLSQGFASGEPPDLFYLGNDQVASFAEAGNLAPLDDLSNVGDFYESLRDAYTIDGTLYAAPKDFSTLALIINSGAWADAGLTDADIPTTWEELASVAAQLTTDERVGLTTGPEFQRLGVFMAQAGGWLVSEDGTTATVNSPENVEALNFVKQLMADGSMRFSSDLGAGWGGEAFGKELAAMTIEGNWIAGAMQNDFPDLEYQVVELPAGPAGKGTMQYDGGWGLAAASPNQEAAKNLIEHLTSPEVVMANAEAFGVMPSLTTVADEWTELYPEFAAFLAGAEYSKSIPGIVGISTIVTDFNAQIQGLASGDPKTILDRVQQDLEAILNQ